MRKIITLLLAVAMLAGVVMLSVACGKDPAGPTTTDPGKVTTDNPDNPVTGGESTSTKPSGQTTTNPSGQTTTNPSGQTTTNPSGGTTGGEDPTVEWDGKTKLPGKEDVDFGGRTFFIASINDNQGYDTTSEVWVEALTNESYNDSVFERNKIMQELYNCTIKVDMNGQDGYAADFASGGGKYIAGTSQYAGYSTPKGYYNIHSLGFDLTQDWWDQNYISDMTYDGKLYSIIGDFARTAMECTWVLIFNKTVYENGGIEDDIYQLVKDRKWTIDKMMEMCQKVLNDGDGDQAYKVGSAANSDTIGFSSSQFSYRAFFFGCGERYVTKNSNDKFAVALTNGKGAEVLDKIINFYNDDSYQNSSYTVYPEALKANKLLFEGEILNALVRFKDVEDLELGVLPFPLFDENQQRYYLHVNNHLPVYGIPTSFANTDIINDFWTLYAAHSRYTVRKAFVDSCKYVWTSDEENGEMMDIILDSRIYDPGYNWNIASSFDTTLVSMVESGDNRFSGYANKQVRSIETNIANFDTAIGELER